MNLISKMSILLALSPVAIAQNTSANYDANYSISGTVEKGSKGLHPLELEILNNKPDTKGVVTNYWMFLTASGASSYDSSQTYVYKGGGCMSGEGNGSVAWLDQPLQIPDGHSINFMRFYFRDDTAGGTVSAHIQKADGEGGATNIQSLTSDIDTGYGSVGIVMSHIVDNISGAYYIRFGAEDNASLRVCGVRLVIQTN